MPDKENIILIKSEAFALDSIELYKQLLKHNEYVLSKQFIRNATSIGANVNEASAAQTKKDFIAKMAIASKEARETKYWLSLLSKSKIVDLDYSKPFDEICQIISILTAIVKTSQENIR